jgi:hypothetical protein
VLSLHSLCVKIVGTYPRSLSGRLVFSLSDFGVYIFIDFRIEVLSCSNFQPGTCMKNSFVLDVTLCSLVEVHRRLRGNEGHEFRLSTDPYSS